MTISQFFSETLSAPFRNTRWSWGAVNQRQRRVFLRLWQDDREPEQRRIRVLEKSLTGDSRPGLAERRHHLELIRTGEYAAFGVLCQRDGPESPIRDFHAEALLRLNPRLVEDSAYVYAVIDGAVSVTQFER
jgi:hypothetical protein